MIFPPITVGQRLLILNTTWKHCQSIENMFKGWFLNISQVWVISRRFLDITKILSDQCHFNVKNSEGWFCPQITLRSKVNALKRHLIALPTPCAWSYLRIGPLLGLSMSRLLICVPHVKQADVKIRILGWSLGSWLTPSCSPSSCRFPRRSSWSSSSACPSGLWPTQCTRRTTACCTGGSRGY